MPTDDDQEPLALQAVVAAATSEAAISGRTMEGRYFFPAFCILAARSICYGTQRTTKSGATQTRTPRRSGIWMTP